MGNVGPVLRLHRCYAFEERRRSLDQTWTARRAAVDALLRHERTHHAFAQVPLVGVTVFLYKALGRLEDAA